MIPAALLAALVTATLASGEPGHPEPFDSGAFGASAQDKLRSAAPAAERSRRAPTATATPAPGEPGHPERSSAAPAAERSRRAPTPPAATPLSVQAQVSKLEVELGEPFELAIEIRHRPEERYELPPAAALPGPPFHAEPLGCRREVRGAEALTRCGVRLALFALGRQDAPPIRLPVETAGGWAELDLPGLQVTGVGMLDPRVPASALELRDLAPPVPLRLRSLRLLAWALGLAAVGLAAALAFRAWRRAASRRDEPPPLSPEERLARRLDDLAALGLGARGEGREHFFRLSEAIRGYLGARTGIPALDLTTAEIVERLAVTDDPRLDLAALRAFLEEADLVKFARAPAPAAACEAGLAFGRALLARLRPPPPGPGPGTDRHPGADANPHVPRGPERPEARSA